MNQVEEEVDGGGVAQEPMAGWGTDDELEDANEVVEDMDEENKFYAKVEPMRK